MNLYDRKGWVWGLGHMPNTLKNIIADALREKNITQKDVQIRSNGRVKQGNLSAALKGTRHFTLDMLDAITEVLDLPFGHFYPHYVHECTDVDGNRIRKKCEEFIVRCVNVGKAELAQSLIDDMIQEGPANIDTFLKIADKLAEEGHAKDAVNFYDLVIEMDNDKLSERLANTMYKRFTIVRDWGMETAYDAAIQLLGYIRNVTFDQLEAYRKVIACFFVCEKWEKVIHVASELAEIARERKDEIKYGQALLYKIRAMYYIKDFEQALEIVEEIVRLKGDADNNFKMWGEGNRYNLLLACGQLEVVNDFANWLEKHRSEIPSYISNILDVCIKRGEIDKAEALESRFRDDLITFANKTNKDPFEERLFARIMLMKSKILFSKQQYKEAIDLSLNALDYFVKLKLQNYILTCIKDLHLHKDFLDHQQNRLLDSLFDAAINMTP
jgi:tetratricopeptide (TPR) repeat protein